MSQWAMYHRIVGNTPNPLAVDAVDYVQTKKTALDIGAGNLRDSRFLKSTGFERVVAVDPDESSLHYASSHIELHTSSIQDLGMEENTFDLILGCNVLFFLTDEEIRLLLKRILASLKPGGILACNTLGVKDQLYGKTGAARYNYETLASLTIGFDVLGIAEQEGDRRSIIHSFEVPLGTMHLWSLVLRKPFDRPE
jgi:2-polyprenyl-3-methyl-5-hydroxy-6-metoxy-1,4-benzoquinol methylase